MGFKKASKQNATIKLAITGPSGSGKTYSALLLAKGLGGSTAILDTEFGSASLYADIFDFDTWDGKDPKGFPPEYFVGVIKAAEEAGYHTLIIDSLSHEWNGRGGCLEIATAIGKARYSGNTYAAWSEVTPRHNRLVEAIVGAKINIIVTMRAKTEYVLSKDEKSGKSSPQKVGLGSIQRDGTDYEFTTMFELERDHHLAVAGKDRTGLFKDPIVITEETGRQIAAWLSAPETVQEEDAVDDHVESKTVQKGAQRQDPGEYVRQVISTRIQTGETLESIERDFADILKRDDVKPIEELTHAEVRLIARELYRRANPKRGQ